MTVYALGETLAFPDPRDAEPGGLLAVGGDLRPERLLLAYRLGIFPWYEDPPILWFSPDPRMALRPAELRVHRRLERTLRQERLELRLDTAFETVIRSCARIRRRGQRGTWITSEMVEGYLRLHELGFAHSAETWRGGQLVGGVYGVSLGGAFFGESMFHRERDASKVALVGLVRHLHALGFPLFDCQVHTRHLEQFGAREWPRERFLQALEEALALPTRRGRWRLEDAAGAEPSS